MSTADREPDGRWLETEDRWRRLQLAAVLVAAALVGARTVTVGPGERVPEVLVIPAFVLSGVALVCAFQVVFAISTPDAHRIRDDRRTLSREDRRELRASLRRVGPVRDDLVEPAARVARARALQTGVGWLLLMNTGVAVSTPSQAVGLGLGVLVVAGGVVTWWARKRAVTQYRVIRAQRLGSG